MAKQKCIHMVAIKIFTSLILLSSLGIFTPSYSQSEEKDKFELEFVDSILSSNVLYDIENSPVELVRLKENSIFLWVTDKSCMPCYSKLEKYFEKNYTNYDVNIIATLGESPLEIRSKTANINEFYKNYNSIFFIYTRNMKTEVEGIATKLSAQNSPFFFVVKNKQEIIYVDANSATKLIY